MLMQALSMDESRLLPKGRAVYQRNAAFGAFALHAKVGLIFIAPAMRGRSERLDQRCRPRLANPFRWTSGPANRL